jgi:anti-sigma factor RsiW
MSCAKGKEAGVLIDYCAGTLEAAQAAEFEKHIGTCDDCRQMVEVQRDLWKTMDRWTPPPVSSDFDARLYARIAREAAPSPWIRWWRMKWTPAISLAALCAMLAVALLVRLPAAHDAAKQIRPDRIDIEQVEQTLEDLDVLTPAS